MKYHTRKTTIQGHSFASSAIRAIPPPYIYIILYPRSVLPSLLHYCGVAGMVTPGTVPTPITVSGFVPAGM